MSNYLYRTALYTDTSNVVSVPADNSTNLTEYQNNHQSDTIKISSVQIAETTFASDIDYDDFDTLVASPYDWTDVKELTHNNRYELYLVTSEPL